MKKLKLHKETVRNLTDNELREVAGGCTRPIPCDGSTQTLMCSSHGAKCWSYLACISKFC